MDVVAFVPFFRKYANLCESKCSFSVHIQTYTCLLTFPYKQYIQYRFANLQFSSTVATTHYQQYRFEKQSLHPTQVHDKMKQKSHEICNNPTLLSLFHTVPHCLSFVGFVMIN